MKDFRAVLTLVGLVVAGTPAFASDHPQPTVLDSSRHVIRAFDAEGAELSSPPDAGATGTGVRIAASACKPVSADGAPIQSRRTRRGGATVDPCGRVAGQVPAASAEVPAPATALTIDRMTTRGSFYGAAYSPGGSLLLLGRAEIYTLSDGTAWGSGAGTTSTYSTGLERVETSGDTIRYILFPPAYAGNVYQQTDYDSGDHSSQGVLAAAGPLVLEATAGSTTAVMRGTVTVVSNTATSYGEPRFNYFSAVVGSVVPFEQTYTLHDGATWQADTFTHSFSYINSGVVDFAHPTTTPRPLELTIGGAAQVLQGSATQFSATVRYDNGVLKTVTAAAAWDVQPAALATITGGLLTTGTLGTAQETLTLGATWTAGDASLSATKSVVCRSVSAVEGTDSWPMYQGNASHTGYLPLALDPARAALRWQRTLGTTAVNPVSGADGRVFASLYTYFGSGPHFFALDASTGATLWSKSYDHAFSVNPPSTAYGTVYVQTGNHSTDTWLRAYDAGTGEVVFQTPHQAQWERYYAPTIYEGKAYVNGGSYGGMYGFDAFAGTQTWFQELEQYDQWTPAVAGGMAYAYVGKYSPGLYALDRATGRLAFVIPDSAFVWNGWSMNEAPTIGSQDDVLAIHDGRMISFDVALRTIRWQRQHSFSGQPSVARGVIYALDGGRLVALDEASGAELWAWQPPSTPQGTLIVTDSHVLVSTATSVHAVDLVTRQSAWSYPVGGLLALADGNLYVASANGVLTAITMPRGTVATLESLEVSGPAQVVEGSSATYHAYAHYSDGRVVERSLIATWSAEPTALASVAADGTLTAAQLIRPSEVATVRARLTEDGHTVEGTRDVTLVVGVTVPALIQRNIERSVEIKHRVVRDLAEALAMERAAFALQPGLAGWRPGGCPAPLCQAIAGEENAKATVTRTIGQLEDALRGVTYLETPTGTTPEPANQP